MARGRKPGIPQKEEPRWIGRARPLDRFDEHDRLWRVKVANTLIAAREYHRITQQETSDLLSCSLSTYRGYEIGTGDMNIARAKQIVQLMTSLNITHLGFCETPSDYNPPPESSKDD